MQQMLCCFSQLKMTFEFEWESVLEERLMAAFIKSYEVKYIIVQVNYYVMIWTLFTTLHKFTNINYFNVVFILHWFHV